MYVKNIIKILTIFSITLINSPQKVYAQIYDEKIIPEYYYRSFNNLPAIRQSFQYLDEINSPEAPHISVPISAIVDLRLLELPQELAKEYNAHLERYNYIY